MFIQINDAIQLLHTLYLFLISYKYFSISHVLHYSLYKTKKKEISPCYLQHNNTKNLQGGQGRQVIRVMSTCVMPFCAIKTITLRLFRLKHCFCTILTKKKKLI